MKKIFSRISTRCVGAILLMLCFASIANAASITTVATGNFGTAATWPATARTGTITSATNSTTVTGVGTKFTTEFTVGTTIANSAGTTIGVVSSIQSDLSLTLSGNAAVAVSGGTYTIKGAGSVDDVTIGAGFTLTVDINATINSLTIADPNSSTASTEGLTINSGITLTVSGAFTQTANSKGNDALTISGSGTLVCGSFNMNTIASPSGNNTSAVTVTSTISNFTVNGAFTLNGTGSSKINNPTFTLTSGILTINGLISTVNAASANISSFILGASSPTLNLGVSGNPFSLSATVGSTSTITLNGTGATVNYKGTSAQTIYTTTYTNLKSNNTAGATLGGALTTTNLTIGDVVANSIFNDGGFQLTSTGTLNLASGTFKSCIRYL